MSETKILIHAAGKSERWDGEGHKQLLRVYEETIIGRLIRRVHCLGYRPTVVTKSDDIIWEAGKRFPIDVLIPAACDWHIQTLFSSRHLWDERTVVLFGDTLYAPGRIEHILAIEEAFHFWGNVSQLFAMSFTSHIAILSGISDLLRIQPIPGRLIDLYRQLVGLELGQTEIGRSYTMVEDPWTMDIDSLADYGAVMYKTNNNERGRDQWM